jgi:hypothetical protein
MAATFEKKTIFRAKGDLFFTGYSDFGGELGMIGWRR